MNAERLILRIALATEVGAGILLAVGLFTPPAGVLLVMVTATLVFVSWPHEYPLYLLFVAVAIALSGGTEALDVGFGLGGAVTLEVARKLTRQRGDPASVVACQSRTIPEGRRSSSL
jgi:uncharacterized membrane protein YphA (DoxX/SURF4 family)